MESNEISLDKDSSLQLNTIANSGFGSINKIELSRNQRTKLLVALINYYKFHLPEVGRIKSLDVLNQVFEE